MSVWIMAGTACTVVNETGGNDGGDSGTTDAGADSTAPGSDGGADGGTDGATDAPASDAGSDASPDGGSGGGDGGGVDASGDAGSSSDAAADADLPPPDLSSVCPGPDPYEPNNTQAAAHPLTLDSLGRVRIGAGVTQSDTDFYSFVAPKHDPVWVTTNYGVTGTNSSSLSLSAYDATQSFITEDNHTRTTPTDTLNIFWEANAAGTYAVNVASSTDACTGYDLYVKALYCTDIYEDNDDQMHAAPITLDSTSKASIDATIDGLDDDFYQFTAPKADPMSAVVTYTRPANDMDDLSLRIYDATSSFVTEDTTPRSMPSQTLTTVWQATAAGAIYHVGVTASTDGVCAPYNVAINGLWCTDAFEDNDSFTTAVNLPTGMQSATIANTDDDYFVLATRAANGSCSVSYTVPTGSAQQLAIRLYDATQSFINEDTTARSGSSQTLTATWTASSNAPTFVKVSASVEECTPYTIICH